MTTTSSLPGWYRDWFGEEYLSLYPHRDEEEARSAVQLVLGTLGAPEGLVLDLACGAGRHLVQLEDRGLAAVGLDLSAPLLRQARSRSGTLRLVRGDMRQLPFGDASFDLVVNFFTSFGYFSDPEEDLQVLDESRRVLRSGAGFALDFLNARRVRDELVPRDEREARGRRVVQERRLEGEGRTVVKTIRIFSEAGDEESATYHERVRLYEPDELRGMLESSGFRPQRVFGDYNGGELEPDSPRCIWMGRAT